MKFLHIGDLHLGKTVNEISMIDEQRYILNQILDLAQENQAQAILAAGDIYDRLVPGEDAVQLLNWFLSETVRRGLLLFMISGNHDSQERLNFGTEIFRSKNIYIVPSYKGVMPMVTLNDEYGPVNLYMLPYIKPSVIGKYHNNLDISSFDAAVSSVVSNVDIHRDERNILLAHQFVNAEGLDPIAAGSENVRPENVGMIEKVDYRAFNDYDYVALGHMHRAQEVGRNTIRYCGSPLKYSLNEAADIKTVPLVTLKEKGNVEIELCDLTPRRNLRHIIGQLEDILQPEHVTNEQDYVYVTLTDEADIPAAAARIRSVYPNVICLDYDNAKTREVERTDVTQAIAARSFEEIIGSFYAQMLGGEPTEEEWAILRDAAGKAGLKR